MLYFKGKIKRLLSIIESYNKVPWVMSTGCCSIEVENLRASRYNWQRLGICDSADSSEDADLLVIAGWISEDFADAIKREYALLRGDKSVIAVGACAISGAPYLPSGKKPILASDLVPIDIFVPGCPPRPESILQAIQSINEIKRPMKDRKAVINAAIKSN